MIGLGAHRHLQAGPDPNGTRAPHLHPDDPSKAADGQEISLAEAKARIARHSSATDLTTTYLRYRHLHPEQLAAFVDDASKQTPLMVDRVWGARWVACATVRAMAAYRAAADAID
ncbi:hypothetical protein ACFRFU_52280 [Streptomyces sp. NPDC056704]|uniref:hypothetical protein n=1 Tax=Streptomyces sp. NPDC056704 TaxID=3345917 RepID=UPI0036AE10AF